MKFRLSLLLLFIALSCSGCGNPGPKQTLVFKASRLPGATGPIDLASTKRIVTARVKGAGIHKTRVNISDTNAVEIIVYGASERDLEKLKAVVTQQGSLELAAIGHVKVDQKIAEQAQDVEQQLIVDGELRAEWVPVVHDVNGQAKAEFQMQPDVVSRVKEIDGKQVTQWLIVHEPGGRVTGNLMKSATAALDDRGSPCVHFVMSSEGAPYLADMTRALLPRGPTYRSLAIIFNGTIYSAPRVQSTISDRGMISGDFTQAQVDQMVNVIRGGSVPCQLTFDNLVKDDAK